MRRLSTCCLLVLLWVPAARADVVDSAPNGFSVKVTSDVSTAPASLYRALLTIASWWDPQHTYSGKASNLSIDPRPGGCFCEQLPGGGVQHMTVTFVDAPRTLRLSGGLGPLGTQAVSGSMAWTVRDVGMGKSRIELLYNVGGYMTGGVASVASAVDGVLTTQVARLKAFAETGRPQ